MSSASVNPVDQGGTATTRIAPPVTRKAPAYNPPPAGTNNTPSVYVPPPSEPPPTAPITAGGSVPLFGPTPGGQVAVPGDSLSPLLMLALLGGELGEKKRKKKKKKQIVYVQVPAQPDGATAPTPQSSGTTALQKSK